MQSNPNLVELYLYEPIWRFLSHGGTPKSSKSLGHELALKHIETYGDLGIPHFKKQLYNVGLPSYILLYKPYYP
jgi:hypothetical protein